MSSNFVNGKVPKTEEPSPILRIKDVHISVFFDGTNNNMVQQAYYHTFKNKNYLNSNNSNTDASHSLKKQTDTYKEKEEKIKKKKIKNEELTSLLADQALNSTYNYNISSDSIQKCNILYDEIKKLDEEIQFLQSQVHIDVQVMESDKEKGYSNIAILHSLIQDKKSNDDEIHFNLYIEGSGANDVAFSEGETGQLAEGNVNGLGFGLGKTGVTALVSKAIKYIYDYLISVKSKLDENTNYHFYVFGFSRGATCARLFSELTTRNEGKTLPREKEFGQETSKVANIYKENNNRIPFMESTFIDGLNIKRDNVTVDFLGIYDTVASIGFLKQKDGWTNALSWAYRGAWWNNYHGNFHYMNAHDYGLYSPQNNRVLHTCHICAGDEFRENFALVNLGKEIPKNAMEIIIPGCHSDVGGGYVTENSMDFVLYKFVPRKFEHFLKHNKILEILGYFYLKSKDRARMFIQNPMDTNYTEELNSETLAKLGWIGNEWRGKEPDICENKPYTLRVAEWPNEIKFKRYSIRGYSNIPLRMMKSCVENCSINWLFQQDDSMPNAYKIPVDLKNIGEEMIKLTKVTPEGQRTWVVPKGGYSGELYRTLRLKYLHFTSSCELMHYRSKVKDENMRKIKEQDKEKEFIITLLPREMNFANFGNNCNYDNEARICRIMYNGDEELKDKNEHEKHVHYMYEFGKYGMRLLELKKNIL